MGYAGGLDIIVMVLFGHDINVTINNTVIAENSGFVSGNMYINIIFGVEHVRIRLDRCYMSSSEKQEAGYMKLKSLQDLHVGLLT